MGVMNWREYSVLLFLIMYTFIAILPAKRQMILCIDDDHISFEGIGGSCKREPGHHGPEAPVNDNRFFEATGCMDILITSSWLDAACNKKQGQKRSIVPVAAPPNNNPLPARHNTTCLRPNSPSNSPPLDQQNKILRL